MTRYWISSTLVILGVAACNPAERAAQDIAAKNAKARGGLSAWQAVGTLTMWGKLEAGTPRDPVAFARSYQRSPKERKAEARRAALHADDAARPKQVLLPFAMELKRPKKSRLEVQFQGQTAVQVFDGVEGWKLRPFLGRREVEPYSAEELKIAAGESELDGPLLDYASHGGKAELLGTEPVEGRDTYKIRVTSEDGGVRTVWVDTETFLDVRVDGTRRLDGKARTVWTYFRDYRPVDGLMIPYVLETRVEGVPGAEKILIDRVALNREVPNGRFSKPG